MIALAIIAIVVFILALIAVPIAFAADNDLTWVLAIVFTLGFIGVSVALSIVTLVKL